MGEGDGGLVTVYVSAGQLPALAIKAKLEAAGIPALLEYESAGVVLGLTVDGLGEVRVLVPAEDAADALALLTEEPDASAPTICEEGDED
jgi:hypothetical protein